MNSSRLLPRLPHAALIATLAISPALATADAPTPPEAVKTCSACHGPAGVSVAPHIPNLAGQKQAYIEAQLAAFHSGKRSHDLMGPIARQLNAAQRASLAAHFAGLNPQPAAGTTAASAPRKLAASPFPSGFPEEFRIYQDEREGNNRKLVWANAAALEAARSGQTLPDGSAIVVENRQVESQSADKAARSGDVREVTTSFAVMQSATGWGDEVPELLRNGNWRYGLFDGERKAREKAPLAECLACHKPKAADSFVFSLSALRSAAEKTAAKR